MERIAPHDLVPIRLEAEIDLSVEPAECRIKRLPDDSPWHDLGYWLEAVGWLATAAAREKNMPPEEMADYCRQYILKCLNDYKPKPKL